MALLLIASSSATMFPSQAHAQLGSFFGGEIVLDPSNLVENTLSAAKTHGLWVKEYVLDPVAWAIANAFIQEMTASIIDWAASGFEGSPAFVTDFEGFFRNIADQEIGRFIEGTELGFLCSPLDIKIALQFNYHRQFRDRVSCTLTDIVENVEQFTSGDFSQGGWEGWFELTTRRSNNPYGAYLIASNEISRRIAAAQGREAFQIELGDGFLSQEYCRERPANPSDPGSRPGIEDCRITTPGVIIEEQVNEALGLPQQKLLMADEIDEIIGAVALGLVQQALSSGLSALSGSGSDGGGTSGGGPSYTDRLRGTGSNTTLIGSRTQESAAEAANKDLDDETDYRNTKQRSLSVTEAAEESLLTLKACYEQPPAGVSRTSDALGDPEEVQQEIDEDITPTKTNLELEIEDSQSIINELLEIRGAILTAQNNSQFNTAVRALRDVNPHSRFNVLQAQDEQERLTTTMGNIKESADERLAACNGGETEEEQERTNQSR